MTYISGIPSRKSPRARAYKKRDAKVFSREDDLVILRLLHMRFVDGLTAKKAGEKFGLTKNAVIGKQSRVLNDKTACYCKKPENKDGALATDWWENKP